uniref:Uncharacterized protein n=1 Tax=Nelumbo nucifera TaxID=4432 RepID=A0A822XSK7_NELNU|nr:TPA_asm: hypothetical protein HUJ06_024146 [Nelumbo nucifera]
MALALALALAICATLFMLCSSDDTLPGAANRQGRLLVEINQNTIEKGSEMAAENLDKINDVYQVISNQQSPCPPLVLLYCVSVVLISYLLMA